MKRSILIATLVSVPLFFGGCAKKAEEATPSIDVASEPLVAPPEELAQNVQQSPMLLQEDEVRVRMAPPAPPRSRVEMKKELSSKVMLQEPMPTSVVGAVAGSAEIEHNTEAYNRVDDNPFQTAARVPLSTFSIDVDGASYANSRRYLTAGSMPPPDAVRIEEFLNYFNYGDAEPTDEHPFAVTTEVATTPWNSRTRLVRIGLQARKAQMANVPANNLVFLIDVSGSMEAENKLPLLKRSLSMLVEQLRPQDRVSLCVYAGSAGLVLPPTSGRDKTTILEALDRLQSGGSTAGGAGILLAYATAHQAFLRGGNNRILLATDGDFNVGASSDGEMIRLVEKERASGVFLSVLGFGMGNYKDSKLEQIADKGNGNYAYIDNLAEARRVLVEQASGTLLTVAKDVKLQVEFNPAEVESYRLIGYENRLLRDQDFEDDTKDAGEMGAGHTVTALYEVAPKGIEMGVPGTPALRYSKPLKSGSREHTDELMQVKVRYQKPEGSASRLFTKIVRPSNRGWRDASPAFRFASAVAEFGLLMRNSPYKGESSYANVLDRASHARLSSTGVWHDDFLTQVRKAQELTGGVAMRDPDAGNWE